MGCDPDEVDEYIGDPDEVDEYIGEDGGGEHMGGSWDMHMGCGVDDIDILFCATMSIGGWLQQRIG